MECLRAPHLVGFFCWCCTVLPASCELFNAVPDGESWTLNAPFVLTLMVAILNLLSKCGTPIMRQYYMIFLAITVIAIFPLQASARILTSVRSFSELGESTVKSTGPSMIIPTTIIGDAGLSAGPSVVGSAIPRANTVVEGPGSTGLVDGTIYVSHPVAEPAQIDNTSAYNGSVAVPLTSSLTGIDRTARLMRTLTVNPQGLNNDDPVVQTASSSVVTTNNAGSNNRSSIGRFGKVGPSETRETITGFEGDVVALTGVVTMDTNMLSSPFSNMSSSNNGQVFYDESNLVPIGRSATVAPEPGTFLILGSGLVGLLGFRRRFVPMR
jgi:hypothetical protein